MKAYIETKGKPVIDWNARLDRDTETITDEDWEEWENDASSWVTCACGNQCDVIQRNVIGTPEDGTLFKLGSYFYCNIASRNLEWAKDNLRDIEKRSAQLIKEHYQKINSITRHGPDELIINGKYLAEYEVEFKTIPIFVESQQKVVDVEVAHNVYVVRYEELGTDEQIEVPINLEDEILEYLNQSV